MHNYHPHDDSYDNVVFNLVMLINKEKDHQNCLLELNANIASLACMEFIMMDALSLIVLMSSPSLSLYYASSSNLYVSCFNFSYLLKLSRDLSFTIPSIFLAFILCTFSILSSFITDISISLFIFFLGDYGTVTDSLICLVVINFFLLERSAFKYSFPIFLVYSLVFCSMAFSLSYLPFGDPLDFRSYLSFSLNSSMYRLYSFFFKVFTWFYLFLMSYSYFLLFSSFSIIR